MWAWASPWCAPGARWPAKACKLVYAPDQPDLFARICSYFDRAGFSILDARVHTANNDYALDTFQVVAPTMQEQYRELMHMVESDLTQTPAAGRPAAHASQRRLSRRVKAPFAPRVILRPDEKAQHWLLSISASDRAGLLYIIARIWPTPYQRAPGKDQHPGRARGRQLLIEGPELQDNNSQLRMETELLKALAQPG
jgi:[protein-PII] uridylyltransferase